MNSLQEIDDGGLELFWDATYAIAMSLLAHYPHIQPEKVGLYELTQMVESLPGFQDDPSMVTERILMDIQNSWYEESVNL